MKILVLGGSGLIGKKLVQSLRSRGHEAVPASPSSGVDILTGDGLAEALHGASVVIDVTNSPSFEDEAAMTFFETAASHILPAEKAAGVKHHVALSVVGTERLLTSGYFRAKLAQEKRIEDSGVPFTIVRATQFYEFAGGIAQFSVVDGKVRLPPALMRPIVSDDVAELVANVALALPAGGMVEIAGPENIRMDDFVARYLRATGDSRDVVTDPAARYFGIEVNDESLTPGGSPRLGSTRYDDWLRRNPPRHA